MRVFEKAPAKINLSLDVLGKRDDGYHEVEMIMTTIDLYDRIELESLPSNEIQVSVATRYVPSDERNLAYKAAKVMKDWLNIKKGVHIKIKKSIPVAAGLGGGSADAAAVLRGLNRLWNLQLSNKALAGIGIEIGSDVPFCVYNKTALVQGRGEKVTPLPRPPACWVVLAKPDIGVSTTKIFQLLDTVDIVHPQTDNIIQALKFSDFDMLCMYTANVLEQITTELHPEVKEIKQRMVQAGVMGGLMSGSGPTIYGLVKQEKKGQRICNGLRGFCNEVYVVRILG
ncbi:4-(cytidine 5'-diphospho)-2-C-methyl-D-erythritol kinase [Virgibacillus sp. W0181]|uniref:4-(cytidine 5'-diphospho)-2-C-methyl-D-erythritol kinase n=1 Tax=Virgibacillus sp. W0181 TaxID=3391581 RepID=UPI003F4850B7